MKKTGIIAFCLILIVIGCGEDSGGPFNPLADMLLGGTIIVGGTAAVIALRDKPPEGMVKIPAGESLMGSNDGQEDEKPVHKVYLDEFYIDKYEVTNEQYARFLNATGKNEDTAGHKLLDLDSKHCPIERVGDTYRPKSGYEKHPVVEVSWYGAAAYAQWAGKRLPTEAQWEKAARGGLVGRRYPWGDEITREDASYKGASGTAAVGSYSSNGYGLYDMAGNVCEWCADEYNELYYSRSPKENPPGPGGCVSFSNNDFTRVTIKRVLRGGSWGDNPDRLQCSNRDSDAPEAMFNHVGFRCSKNL